MRSREPAKQGDDHAIAADNTPSPTVRREQGAMKTENDNPERGEIVICRTKDGHAALDVRLSQETIWLSQS